MQHYLPSWPQGLAQRLSPRAGLRLRPLPAWQWLDREAVRQARALRDRGPHCSGITGTWTETIFANRADYTAVASTSSEASLLSGVNEQPVLPALFWDGTRAFGRAVSIVARGVLSTTGTPTIIFQARLGTTAGSSYLSGTSVGVSAAITTQSGVTSKWWEARLDLVCNTPGIGTGNTTISGAGYVTSPTGFASPFTYPLEPTTPDTATWTATLDSSLTQYLNLSCTWSASSSSNTATLKQLLVLGLN